MFNSMARQDSLVTIIVYNDSYAIYDGEDLLEDITELSVKDLFNKVSSREFAIKKIASSMKLEEFKQLNGCSPYNLTFLYSIIGQ